MIMRSKIGLSSTNASKLQSVLNAAAHLIGGIPKFSHRSSFVRNYFTDFLFVNASNSRPAPSLETVLLALLHNTSRLTVSQFLLYLVVPPFGLRLRATCLFLAHARLSLSPELLLSWAHPTRT